VSIIEKVNTIFFESFAKHISPRKPFGLDGAFINDENFKSSSDGLDKPIICYGKGKKIGYVEERNIVSNKDWIPIYKVFTPYANNIGTELNDDNLNSFVGEPNTICTETYLVIGFNLNLDSISALNVTKYLKTRFLRFNLSLAKASQHATSKTYQFVPLQDFTSSSDINWDMSISEIDRQLYKKYRLTEGEINFIESMIRLME
jgi:hypothetical protein